MASTVRPTPPKSPQGFTLAEVDGDDARVGHLLREAAHQPDVARPGLDAMAGSDLGEIRPRVSRGVVRFLIIFSIGVGASLAWHWYGDAARAMIATSWPQLASLAPKPAFVEARASPALQQLKDELAQVKQELAQLTDSSASLRQSVDQLAGSQQEIAGTIANLRQQEPLRKLASPPPRPAPAPKPLTPSSAPKPLTPLQAEAR